MKYDIWVVNKKNRAGDDGSEFTATGLFINEGQRIGYKDETNTPIFDGPVMQVAVSETGTILVETERNQYMIKQLNYIKGVH